MDQGPNIVLVASPGMGHLIPLAELAKRLVRRHSLAVTILIPTEAPPSVAAESALAGLPSGIRHVFLPPVSFADLTGEDLRPETVVCLTVSRSLPAIRAAVTALSAEARVAALVADLFATDAFDVAAEFGIPPFVFYPSTAMALSLFLYLRELDASVACEYRDLPEPVQIPGCIPIPGSELLEPLQDRSNDAYRRVLYQAERYRTAEGIMVNSFPELEPGAIKALQEPSGGKPPVYPVGPLVKMGEPNTVARSGVGSECLRWLDEQPQGSVLFVSFGSGGTLSDGQLTELALGMEESEQRFLWVVRRPIDKSSSATFFGIRSGDHPAGFLPAGFLDRVKGRGMVVPTWAPQAEVLAHGATGGFLSHCGWNSTLESVVHGVPMIAWPLYAEQRMNAALLTEEVGAAIRPRASADGITGREEIARVVRGLMEGEEGKSARNRMRELKESAARVLSEDGSSTRSLSELAHRWSTPTRPSSL